MSTAELLQSAVREHQAGHLASAEQIYRKVLADDPNQPDALHLLGVIAHQTGHSEPAVALILRAIQLFPKHAAYHNNLGEALRNLERHTEAENAYRAALALEPNYLDARNNLGIALQKLGRLPEAYEQYAKALRGDPAHVNAHLNLGSLHQQLGDHVAAASEYRRALEIDPNLAQAHNNLGTIDQDEGHFTEALRHYDAALKLDPHYADVHYNRGNILKLIHRPEEAATEFQLALNAKPDFRLAAQRLADVHQEDGDTERARAVLRSVKRQRNGSWLLDLRTELLCPAVLKSQQQLDDFRQQLEQSLDEFISRGEKADLHDLLASSCEPPFNLQFHGRDELPTRRKFAQLFLPSLDAVKLPPLEPRTGKLRLAFIVTDFHELAFAKSMLGVINHFSGNTEIEILCSWAGQRLLTARITNRNVIVRPLPSLPIQRPAAILAGNYDLLYYWEVGTDSQNYFLPFLRLAPVQGTSWGIQLTTGIPTMDFYLSSRLVEIPEAQQHYSEKLFLGATLLTCQPPSPPEGEDWEASNTIENWRQHFGFGKGEHAYVIAQQLGKFHPEYDAMLAGILDADSMGRIVVVGDKSNRITNQLRERFQRTLGTLASRLTFLPRQMGQHYFGLLAAADVLLDPIHFGGVNSTYDGLALGKPIVTLPSQFHRGRLTLGCYRRMDVLDCVVSDKEDYVRLAVSLGSDKDYRETIGRKIREKSHVLFNDCAAATETEGVLIELASRGREAVY